MNEKKASISVVIPLYNKRESIFRTMQSVINQSKKAEEVIVIDDGSTDDSASIVEKHFPHVTLIKQSNAGVSSARNKGAQKAQSDYVAFLDSDDWWAETVLEKIDTLIQRYSSAVMFSVAHYRVDGKDTKTPKTGRSRDELFTGLEFIDLYATCSGIINSSSVCVRRDTFLQCGGFPEEHDRGEDVYVWLSLALRGNVAISPDRLVYIERPIELVRSPKGRASAPAYIQKFCSPDIFKKFQPNEQKALFRFLRIRGLIYSLGLVIKGKRRDAIKIGVFISKTNKFMYPVFLFLSILPSKPLFMLYKRRNRTK